jgi:hypothetical protein
VWEVCKFSDEIIYGKLDMSKFAVELHSVLDGSADKIYKCKIYVSENNRKFVSINIRESASI